MNVFVSLILVLNIINTLKVDRGIIAVGHTKYLTTQVMCNAFETDSFILSNEDDENNRF